MNHSEVVLLAAIPVTLAVVLAFLLPRLSRMLGPLVIVASVVAAVMILNRTDLGRDAWGPALAVIAIFVGAVGIVSGVILIGLGSARARRIPTERSVTFEPPYSKDNPYRIPGPGIFTPKRLFIFVVGMAGVLGVVAWAYSRMA
jgi:hypothetical protein